MNDDELDRLVAGLSPVRDRQVARLDLRDAEDDLLEDIMATTTTRISLRGDAAPDSPRHGGHRLRTAFAVGAVAAAALAVVAIALNDGADVVTETPNDPSPTVTAPTAPRALTTNPLIAQPIPEGYRLLVAEEKPTGTGGTMYEASYQVETFDPDSNFSGYTVRTTADTDDAWVEELSDAGASEQEIRGHPAVGEGAAGTQYISWQEEDNVVVTVSFSGGPSEGAFDAFIAALRPAGADEWQDMLQSAPPQEEPTSTPSSTVPSRSASSHSSPG